MNKFKLSYNNLYKNKKISNYFIKIKSYSLISNKYIFIFITLVFCISYIFVYKRLKIILGSFFISLVVIAIPYYIINFIEERRKRKIINLFPNLLVNLKSYCIVKNDIVEAFARIIIDEPIKGYIDKFNYLIKSGVPANECFENLKKDVNIDFLNNYITLFEYCYVNGGNFSVLLDKMIKMLMNLNIKREKEIQNNFSLKIMILMIIMINIIIIKLFIFDSPKYLDIITNTFLGKIILDINIITYCVIAFKYINLNKMEE